MGMRAKNGRQGAGLRWQAVRYGVPLHFYRLDSGKASRLHVVGSLDLTTNQRGRERPSVYQSLCWGREPCDIAEQ